jgi:hypothetical protein
VAGAGRFVALEPGGLPGWRRPFAVLTVVVAVPGMPARALAAASSSRSLARSITRSVSFEVSSAHRAMQQRSIILTVARHLDYLLCSTKGATRTMRRWGLSCLVVLAGVFFVFAQTSIAATGWSVVPTPRASDVSYAVSCTASGACIAVGSLTDIWGSTRTLAEQSSEGREWSVVNTPGPTAAKSSVLLGIACTASNSCMAVGTYTAGARSKTLAESWDGTSWSITPTPNPVGAADAQLNQLSCTAATACTAVGYYTREGGTLTLVERWNGTEWMIQESPVPSESTDVQLHGVSCASASVCTAVGYYLSASSSQEALAERWNGTSWTLQTVPSPQGSTSTRLGAVSCPTVGVCTAVGTYASTGTGHALAERWNGTAWHVQPTPDKGSTDNELSGVSCTGASACNAVGSASGSTLAERWSGAKWVVQETPMSAVGSALSGISCNSATACQAAGDNGEGGSLEELLSGSEWSIRTTPHGSDDSDDVSCTSSNACTAVGSYYPLGPLDEEGSTILAERWNGTTWSAQRVPSPVGTTTAIFAAVSCTAVSSCTAAGSYTSTTGVGALTLVEHWNGTKWSIQETPNASGARNDGFEGLSCSTKDACTAVGTDEAGLSSTTFVERWNGIQWSIQESPNPTESSNAQLYEVSCASSISCVAVGHYYTSTAALPLVERWNGAAWSIETVPLPSGGESGALFGVSCSATSACTAVGEYTPFEFASRTLAERWNGTTWAAQPTPSEGIQGNSLASVSCRTLNACSAVGSSSASTLSPLAEGWNGTEWLIEPTPNPEPNSDLRGVSCTAATFCMAVGAHDNAGGSSLDEIYTG